MTNPTTRSKLRQVACALGLLAATAAPAFAQAGPALPYDTTGNLAFAGNGFAAPAVVSSELFPELGHLGTELNDGIYGNPSSWIAANPGSFATIDLGQLYSLEEVVLGRDRTGTFFDRPPGAITVSVSEDGVEYVVVGEDFVAGWQPADQRTIALQPNVGRYVRVMVELANACLDEIEVHGAPAPGTPVEMAAFDLVRAKVRFGGEGGDDDFEVSGTFALGVSSDGVDLTTDEVTLHVGTHHVTIPAGSWVQVHEATNKWKLATPHDGLDRCVLNLELGTFKARGKNVDLTGTANPVEVKLEIGDDTGTAKIRVRGHLQEHEQEHEQEEEEEE